MNINDIIKNIKAQIDSINARVSHQGYITFGENQQLTQLISDLAYFQAIK